MKKAKAAATTEDLPFRTVYARLKARKEKLYARQPKRRPTETQQRFVASVAFSTSEVTLWKQKTAAERGEAKAKGGKRAAPLTAKTLRSERKGRPPVLEEDDTK